MVGQHSAWISTMLRVATSVLIVLGGVIIGKNFRKKLCKSTLQRTAWTTLSNQALNEFCKFAGKFNGLYSRLFRAVEEHQVCEVRKSLLAWGERLQGVRAAYYREWFMNNMGDIDSLTDDDMFSRADLFCKEMKAIGISSDSGPYANKDDSKFNEKFIVQDDEVASGQRYRVVDCAWLLRGEVVERGTVITNI